MENISLLERWKNRSCYSLEKDNIPPLSYRWLTAGIISLVIIVIARSWSHFTHPAFYAEDSIHYFNLYYGNQQDIGIIFSHPHGYYNVINNIIALLIAKLDILVQPLAYHLTALTIGITTVATFSFSGLIRNKYILFITPLLLGLSGMNHVYYYISITFQMYVLIVFALVLLFKINKPTGIFLIPFFIFLSLLIWSGPYSVLIVPYSLCYILLFKDKTPFFVTLTAVCLFYVFSVDSGTIHLENLFNPDIIAYWVKALASQIFYMELFDKVGTAGYIVIGCFFTIVYTLLYKDFFFLKTSLLFLCVIILSYAPYTLSTKFFVYPTIFPCHKFIGQFFWLAFLLFIFDRITIRYHLLSRFLIPFIMIMIPLFIFYDNNIHPWKYQKQLFPAMPKFLALVKQTEQKHLENRHQQLIIKTKGTDGTRVIARVGDQREEAEIVDEIFVE